MVRSLVWRVLNSVSWRPGALGKAARRLRGMPEPEDVVGLYRLFLGRHPESADAVRGKLAAHWLEVVDGFLRSDEFRQRSDQAFVDRLRQFEGLRHRWVRPLAEQLLGSEEFHAVAEPEVADRLLVRANTFDTTVEVPRDVLDELFRETRNYWESMGDRPETVYWSVLTDERWRRTPDDELVTAFYETGGVDADYMIETARELRPGFRIEHARVLDFGCGVGRMLRHFAGRAAYCEGWDFSAPHLELLEKNFGRLFAVDRACFATRVVDSLDFGRPDPGFELVYSVLTLQHNPPPVMAQMLRELVRSLAKGGIALIHLPTAPAAARYEFSVEEYRAQARREMETHALPRDAVFRIAREEGVTVPWARYDHRCGPGFFEEMFAFARD